MGKLNQVTNSDYYMDMKRVKSEQIISVQSAVEGQKNGANTLVTSTLPDVKSLIQQLLASEAIDNATQADKDQLTACGPLIQDTITAGEAFVIACDVLIAKFNEEY
jgi:hypothetical protein